MRVLLLFRGAPGCGKSTFIDTNGLRPYALSADEIRLQMQSSQQTVYGGEEISLKNEKEVWDTLYKLLETRMRHGEFTVIDATNSKTVEMNKYKDLCEKYRYRIFCIDMTDLPIEECKKRNAGRISLKRVPEEAIDKMYARFRTQKIPSGIKVLKPEQLNDIWIKKFDMSSYEKIVVVGDVHGCNTALMEYFKDGFNDNYFYIFVGDIIDRGIENAETVKFFIDAVQRKNVLVLEGNHERWLYTYSHDETGKSKEFELVTRKQLDSASIDKKQIRSMYRRLGQCAWFTYGDKEVFVSHGGIATMPDNLGLMSTEQMIHGVGGYNDSDIIADTWIKTTKDNMYQIHGHRNVKNVPMKVNDRVYNLEGKVEFGGHLRIVELDRDGFHEIEIKNDVFKPPVMIAKDIQTISGSVADTVLMMRQNKFIQEKQFGNISSFNFTRDAFYDKIWNDQTVKARGLYIDTDRMEVLARSFNKWFRVNEVPETKFEMLQHKFKFPITCYVKENGFLGMVSYNPNTDDLFIATKSCPDGPYAEWLKDAVYSKIKNTEKLKELCKTLNVTFVFECVDMEHDPHIIDYPENKLVLLAIIKNSLDFRQFEYDELVNIANEIGVEHKVKATEISDWTEFVDWYNTVTEEGYEFDDKVIEGFVIEDSNGFMTKVKLSYYNFWKSMRGVAHMVLKKGYIDKTSILYNALSNDFYGFMQSIYKTTTKEERHELPTDIIYWRNRFYKEYTVNG